MYLFIFIFKHRQSSNIKAVQIESCIMNPIGALQELCTAYKWIPPTYNTQKMHPCSSDYKIAYRVICHVFFLQTEGINPGIN